MNRHDGLPTSSNPQAHSLYICSCIATTDLFWSSKFSGISNYGIEYCSNLWVIFEPQRSEKRLHCALWSIHRSEANNESRQSVVMHKKLTFYKAKLEGCRSYLSVYVWDAEIQTDAMLKLQHCVLWLLERWHLSCYRN